jgi:hypothetical protein
VKFSISTNFPDVQRQLAQLQDDVAKKAAARAVNRTLDQAKTAMSKEIRSEFNMAASKVSAALRVRNASYRNGLYRIEGTLESPSRRGRSLNLINFAERSISMAAARKRMAAGEGGSYQLRGQTRQKQLELRFKIRKTGPAKVIKGAFIGNDGRTVFIRTGNARLPIKALQTIDVAQMFNTKRINARVVLMMQEKFPVIFEREAKFYTDKFNAARAA